MGSLLENILKSATQSGGIDLGSILGGGAPASSGAQAGGIDLGSIIGGITGGSSKNSGGGLGSVLGSVLGGGGGGGLGSVLGSILGGGGSSASNGAAAGGIDLGAILGQITKAGASKSTGAAAGGIDLGSVLGAIAGGGKGLDLGGGPARYVVGTDTSANIVYVTADLSCPALWTCEDVLEDAHWIAGEPPEPGEYLVRTRHTGTLRHAQVEMLGDGRVLVRWPEPVRTVAPGQSAVIYDGRTCLGGGIIRFRMRRYR